VVGRRLASHTSSGHRDDPKLIPIVTTADTMDAVELAQTYIHRWPAQENVIKEFC
jgi:hypothetical protein